MDWCGERGKNTDGDQKNLYRLFISISPSLESFSGVEWFFFFLIGRENCLSRRSKELSDKGCCL